jgi:uncharacterized membrane protein
MTMLVAGLVVFFGVHSLRIFAAPLRDRLATRLGEGAWKGLYSLVAIAGFLLIIKGFGAARAAPVVLYAPAPWLRWVAVLLLAPVFPMLLAAYLPGRIRSTLKHPMLAAIKAWALAHLLANGTLADLLLFGSFLVWAVADRISVGRRPIASVPALPAGPLNDAIVVVLGLALYAAFLLGLHQRLFGVAPLG